MRLVYGKGDGDWIEEPSNDELLDLDSAQVEVEFEDSPSFEHDEDPFVDDNIWEAYESSEGSGDDTRSAQGPTLFILPRFLSNVRSAIAIELGVNDTKFAGFSRAHAHFSEGRYGWAAACVVVDSVFWARLTGEL